MAESLFKMDYDEAPPGASCATGGSKSTVYVCSGGSPARAYRCGKSGLQYCCPIGQTIRRTTWLVRLREQRMLGKTKPVVVESQQPPVAPPQTPSSTTPATILTPPSIVKPPAPQVYVPTPAPRLQPQPQPLSQANLIDLFRMWLNAIFGGYR